MNYTCESGLYRGVMLLIGSLGLAVGSVCQAAGEPGPKSIGLVLTVWQPAIYQTADGKDECPAGLQFTNKDNYLRQFTTPAARADFERKFLRLGYANVGDDEGSLGHPEQYMLLRGAGGANVVYNPSSTSDPLPIRLVRSKLAYGLRLDGTIGGEATPRSCRHEKFDSPEGDRSIDNQLYRLYGCAAGWRKGGYNLEYTQGEFKDSSYNRVLIEISGVDDEHNSSHVVVRVFKGADDIPVDGAGKPIPWQAQRIDVRYPQLMSETTGAIAGGVLTTEPVDQRFALYQSTAYVARYLRGMRIRLKLDGPTADGLIAGYEDLEQWWDGYSKGFGGVANEIGLWSPPAFYAAAHQLADGYPDPQTGQCTAISAAYHVQAVRALIVRPPDNDPLVTDGALKLAESNTTEAK